MVKLIKDGPNRHSGLCPFHQEKSPSFTIFIGNDGKERFHCFGCGKHGDVLDYVMETRGVSLLQAAEIITGVVNDLGPRHNRQNPLPPHDPYARVNPLPMPSGVPMPVSGKTINVWNPRRERYSTYTPTAVYRYSCGFVLRIEFEKDTKITPQIMWCEHDGKTEWSHYTFPKPRPLYGLESIPAKGQIMVVEGEKTADAARRLLNTPVVTWAGGTSAVEDTDYSQLAGRSVVIVPDADDPGRKAAAQIALALNQVGAARIKIVDTDGQPVGWDLADAEAEGWNHDEAIKWLKANVQDWGAE
jgi:DNA primase